MLNFVAISALLSAARRATDTQLLEDAERLITVWNEHQARRMPMLFSPTIGAAIAARHWFLWVRCPACRTINAVDLRTLDRHGGAVVTSLIPALSCRSCRPNAPFAELVRLSRISIAEDARGTHATGAGRVKPRSCARLGTVIEFRRFFCMKRRSLGERPKLRLVEGHASHVSQSLNCPNCGQPMTLVRMVRAPHPADDKRRFRCAHCNLDYLVEGQMPARS